MQGQLHRGQLGLAVALVTISLNISNTVYSSDNDNQHAHSAMQLC